MDVRDESRRLLDQLAGGDHQAFWPLWERYRPNLYHHCLGHSGNPDDAEDLLSDVMVKAWERLSDYVGEIRNLLAWLNQFVDNVYMNWCSKKGGPAEGLGRLYDEEGYAPEDSEAPEAEMADPAAESPEEAYLKRERTERLLHLMDELSPDLRDPFILRVFHEMSYLEIAERFNLTEGAVRKRIQESRQQLEERFRACLEEYGEEIVGDFIGSLAAGINGELLSQEMQRRVERILSATLEEIRYQVQETRVVHIPLPSGAVLTYNLVLDFKPARQSRRIETLRQNIQEHPGGWKPRLELAHLLYATGQWEEAIVEYWQVLEKQPNLLDVRLRLGEILRLLERGEEARSVYKEALSQARQSATKHHIQGWMELCRRDYAAAAQEFEQAASLEPRNAAHWHALASVHDQAGRPCECLQAYDEALKLDPDDLVALTRSHNALTATGQLAEAIRRLERVVELDENYVYAAKMLGAHWSAAGRVQGEEGKRTERLIRRALRLAPDAPDSWATLSEFHIRRGEWEKGRAVLREFVERHPDSPKGWFHYAVWHLHTGCYEASAEAILKALSLDPLYYYNYCVACGALPYAGRLEDLRRVVEEMLIRFPERWDTYTDAGEALVRWLGEVERGCELSRQAPQRQPHSPIAWLRHGILLGRAGRPQEAIAAIQRGWALQSADSRPGDRAGAALWLGRGYRALGDEVQARAWLEKAAHFAREEVAFDPANGYVYLAQALEALGDVAGAIQAYQTILDHHPFHPTWQEVEEALARLRTCA